jgi:hypothetical protein
MVFVSRMSMKSQVRKYTKINEKFLYHQSHNAHFGISIYTT